MSCVLQPRQRALANRRKHKRALKRREARKLSGPGVVRGIPMGTPPANQPSLCPLPGLVAEPAAIIAMPEPVADTPTYALTPEEVETFLQVSLS